MIVSFMVHPPLIEIRARECQDVGDTKSCTLSSTAMIFLPLTQITHFILVDTVRR